MAPLQMFTAVYKMLVSAIMSVKHAITKEMISVFRKTVL